MLLTLQHRSVLDSVTACTLQIFIVVVSFVNIPLQLTEIQTQ